MEHLEAELLPLKNLFSDNGKFRVLIAPDPNEDPTKQLSWIWSTNNA
jgi:hypothetical protein